MVQLPPIDLSEAINTARSLRRLKTDPIPDDIIRKVLEAGTKAPSGSNLQTFRFLAVTDPEKRAAIADLYRKAGDVTGLRKYGQEDGGNPGGDNERSQRLTVKSVHYLLDHIQDPPLLLLVCSAPAPGMDPAAAMDGPAARRAPAERREVRDAVRAGFCLAHGTERHAGLSCARAGHVSDDTAHRVRRRAEEVARHSRRSEHVRDAADWLSDRQVWAHPDASPSRSSPIATSGERAGRGEPARRHSLILESSVCVARSSGAWAEGAGH